MSEKLAYTELIHHLHAFRRRLRRQDSVLFGLRGLCLGLALSILFSLLCRTFPLLSWYPLALLNLICLSLTTLLALLWAWLRPRPLWAVALTCDRRLGLAERLSTALEIQNGRLTTSPALGAAQLADARQAATSVDLGSGLPIRLPRREALAALTLAVVLGVAVALPNPMEDVLRRQAKVRQAIDREVAHLEEVKDEVDKLPPGPEREALKHTLDELTRELKEGKLTREEALAKLSEAEGELRSLLDEKAAAQKAALQEAAQSLKDSPLTTGIAEALERGDYQAAASLLESFAAEEGEPLTREEELELARELAQAAEALEDTNPALAKLLREASWAIEAGDIDSARQSLTAACDLLKQTGQRLANQDATGRALAKVQEGKRAIARAGEPAEEGTAMAGGAGEGQGPQGSGQQDDQGQPGGGSGQGDPGGNVDDSIPEADGQVPTNTGQDEARVTPYEPVYAPERPGGQGGEAMPLPGEGQGETEYREVPKPPPEEGEALVPYDRVYGDYRDAAAHALEHSYIPIGLKEYVRGYFGALEP